MDENSKQGVPDVSFGGVPNPNPTFKAVADLAGQKVNGAVLVGHSQSGAFPLVVALLNPSAAKGLVLVEPGGVSDTLHPPLRSRRLRRFRFWPSSAITVTRRRASGFGPLWQAVLRELSDA